MGKLIMKHTHKKSWSQVRNINHLHPGPPPSSVNELLSNFYFEKKIAQLTIKLQIRWIRSKRQQVWIHVLEDVFSPGNMSKKDDAEVDFDCTLKYKDTTQMIQTKTSPVMIFSQTFISTVKNLNTTTEFHKNCTLRGTKGHESISG